MKRLATLLILAGCGGGSGTTPEPPPSACSAMITWDYPISRLDGTYLPREEIRQLTIFVSDAPGGEGGRLELEEVITDTTLVAWEVHGLEAGAHWVYLKVTDTEGNESPTSNELSKEC